MSANNEYDVAILGSGIAGGMLGAVLARNGVKTLLLDAGSHPRFAIGESTIPFTSGMTRIIADRYDVPEIKPLSSFRGVQKHVSRNCGRKQNFGFIFHREGERQNPQQVNQLVVPAMLRTESHLFRQDVDTYLFQTAVKYGADTRLNTRIVDVDIDPDAGVLLRSDRGDEFRASYVVDAGGFRSPIADKFELREVPTRARTHSRSIFTHLLGVRPFDKSPVAAAHGQPNPWHNGTLHHVFDGGWMWVIPFDNHPDSLNPLVSVGLTLDSRVHPKTDMPPEAEFRRFLQRFPDIAWQFEEARPVRPWVATGRLQYSAKQIVGDRFCLTSHAAGFIDPLYSRGMTNTLELINMMAWRLIAAARDGNWSTERFEYLETVQQGLFDFHDDIVYSSFVAFRDYDLWNAVNRTWQLGTMLGNVVIEDAYYRYSKSGEDKVFLDLEQSRYPGSPFPVSDRFNELGTFTRQQCQAVEAGTTTPADAASRIFGKIGEADYLPPSFGFADPANRCFSASPDKMARNAVWSRRSAPPEIGGMMTRATKGLVRMRLRP
ncbi:NAD(P)/FAD-dependent oxidoreductase [Micromonospora sp. CA-259024]|uniref:NAD(P)/FAD-dependent oxidoreductase n=1 Tax=Micromonospora sp. CA-259024 TaxID=3239965 RepID=UPI003D8E68AB